MDVRVLHGVGPVLAYRLESAGLGTLEAITSAPVEDLAAVSGVGPRRAADLKRQSLLLAPAAMTDADVSRAVKRLRQAVPDLAKSKKHARSLKRTSKRMSDLAEHLDTLKSRKRLIAEASRIKGDAKKRTGPKRDAKRLKKLADRVEDAVRSIV